MSEATGAAASGGHEPTRRDFIHIAAGAATVAGGLLALWPFIDQMNPAADTLALSTTEVDISAIPVGSQITVSWRGKPVFIRHRTEEEIATARAVDVATLRDPETDDQRAIWVPLHNGVAARPPALMEVLRRLREAGEIVVCAVAEDEQPPVRCDRVLVESGGSWTVQPRN